VRLLTFSTLFPHAGRPNHGIFVENRLRHLLATGEATSTVVAPVPWFPTRSSRFGDWALHARADRRELRDGLEIHHPRYGLLPRIGMSTAPAALFVAGYTELRRLTRGGLEFDLIDAHYLYPDGVAAVALGRAFGKPVVVTARGSDVTQLPEHAVPRRMIRWAMSSAAALISVSAGLRDAMLHLGAPPDSVTVLRNGVDLQVFRPTDREAMRRQLGLTGPTLLSVGHLIPRKRHHLAIEALAHLPGWRLIIVGEGPERARLEQLGQRLGLASRVDFAGAQPHAALPEYYSAADVMILASSREGWANVLLESMGCGTPVVASNILGNPEVVQTEAAGVIVHENTALSFARAIELVHQRRIARSATRSYAEGFSWDATSAGQIELFRRVLFAA
jgi:glycosyltransferase involved in cell wall biosynthesis